MESLKGAASLTASDNTLSRIKKFKSDKRFEGVVDWVLSSKKEAESARTPFKRQWLLNYAFVNRKQNYAILPNDSSVPVAQAGRLSKSKDNTRVYNRVRSVVRTEIARFISQKPSAVVVPSSSDDEDMFAAVAGEQAWESAFYRLKLQRAMTMAAFWLSVTGTGYLKVWWDPSKWDPDTEVMGDLDAAALTPLHVLVPDLTETELERQQWLIHTYVKPVSWAKQRYAQALEGVELNPTMVTGSADEIDMPSKATEGGGKPNAVTVIEMWLKPGAHRAFPQGGLITLVEDNVVEVYYDEYPYEHGMFPITKFDHVPTGVFYSETPVTDIIDLQRQYNELRHKIAVTARRMGNAQLAVEKGSISKQRMSNETGLMVEYNPGMRPPQPIPIAELPSYLFNELDRILMDIEDISGQHQVSKGSTPPGVTAATAISYLQERDDSYITTAFQSIEQGYEQIARQVLSLFVQYWDAPRKVRVIGADSAYDTELLDRAQLINGTDIRMEGGSALPTSKAARNAFLMDLMAQGFVPPEEGLKMMDMGGPQKIMEALRLDERAAQRENIKIKSVTQEMIDQYQAEWEALSQQGSPVTQDAESMMPLAPPPIVPVNTWDNHEAHIAVHNNFRKGQAYEMLTDAAKQQFEEHVEAHKQAMAQSAIQDFLNIIPGDGTDEGSTYQDGGEPDSMGATPDEQAPQEPPVMPGG